MERLIDELGEKWDLTAEELADIIWLTLIRQKDTILDRPSKIDTPPAVEEVSPAEILPSPPPVISGASVEPQQTTADKPKTTADQPQNNADKPQTTADPKIGIALRRSQTNPLNCQPIKVANPPSIRDPLALVRSLRPLMRQVPSGQIEGLDEPDTARQIAESGIWQPIVKPVLEPFWDVVLVADESASMSIWRQTVLEFRQLLRNYGAFRDVQLWGLYGAEEKAQNKKPCLRPGIGSEALKSAPRQPEEILDPSGRRLIVLISDCVAACWQDEALIEMLGLWSKRSPVTIAQVLPQWLWVRTACRGFEPVQLTALEPGVSNSQLVVDWSGVWEAESDRKTGVCVPIVPLESDAILTWSQMVMGHSEAPGYWVRSSSIDPQPSETASLSPQQRVEQFQVMSSPAAQRLMG
ncbi:MAG: hypothetical protein HC849_25140, partial [Oscillatoriales cyanobacterium RU_3_3]|nr:hypothetical protein [Oscillatoriales cyanobacterium RU_3_3]